MSYADNRVAAEWMRIHHALAAQHLEILRALKPPASASALRLAQESIGREFCSEVIASYLIHDGQAEGETSLMEQWELLSLGSSCARWREQKELLEAGEFAGRSAISQQGVAKAWWDIGWIPIATNGLGDYLVCDMNPAPGGKIGQIVYISHESGPGEVVAPSLADWLGQVGDFWVNAESATDVGTTGGAATCTGTPPAFTQLLGLVGRSMGDSEVKLFLASQPLEREEIEGSELLLRCRPFGYSVTCIRWKIDRVEIRLSGRLDGGVYGGPLTAGITPADQREQLEAKLGPPVAFAGFHGAGPAQTGWVRYQIEGKTVTIAYRADHPGITLIRLGR